MKGEPDGERECLKIVQYMQDQSEGFSRDDTI